MRKILTFTATFLITAAALAGGEVYRWKDTDGTWHYSDQPHPGAELVRRGVRAPGDTSPAPEAPRIPAPPLTTESGPLPVSDAVAAQVRQEAAAAKTEQCKKADEAYRSAITARRFPKKDDKGNVTYLSDAEIDAARLKARAVRDLACGPGA